MNIHTERLFLRRIREDDWPAIQQIWLCQKASAYGRYDKPNDTESEAVQKRIAKWASFAESTAHIFLAVCLKETVIGYLAFNERENGYEIGYNFHSDFHGQGYARESLRAALNGICSATGQARFLVGTALENRPSVRLIQSLGFTQTGSERLSFYKDEQGSDEFFEGGLFELNLQP